MKITAAHINSFKRIDDVRIEPDGDRFLLLIGGKNAQGKSSLLDALTAAFGGKAALPAEPVKRGAKSASITVELDGGTYKINRTVTPDGGGKLEIVGPDGPIRAPQAWLDKLVGQRFLDPLSFLAAPAKEQRRILMAVVGLDLAAFDGERASAFHKRTEVGRDLGKAEGELERLPEPGPAPEPARPMAEITAELGTIEKERQAIRDARAHVSKVRDGIVTLRERADMVRAEIARLQKEADALDERVGAGVAAEEKAVVQLEKLTAGADEAGLDARRESLTAEAARAETVARWQATAEQLVARKAAATSEVERLTKQRQELTDQIASVDKRKAEALAAAVMPVPDLGVTDDGLQLGGVPFDQASQAERLRCSLAIAMRLSPNVRDVWVRDGSLLDDDSLEILRGLAEAADCRIWVERVGERDAGAIVIRDGRVATTS